MDSRLIPSVRFEQDQSVGGAIARYGERIFRPAWPIAHKLGLVKDIVATAFQALTIGSIQDGIEIPNVVVRKHPPTIAHHHRSPIRIGERCPELMFGGNDKALFQFERHGAPFSLFEMLA